MKESDDSPLVDGNDLDCKEKQEKTKDKQSYKDKQEKSRERLDKSRDKQSKDNSHEENDEKILVRQEGIKNKAEDSKDSLLYVVASMTTVFHRLDRINNVKVEPPKKPPVGNKDTHNTGNKSNVNEANSHKKDKKSDQQIEMGIIDDDNQLNSSQRKKNDPKKENKEEDEYHKLLRECDEEKEIPDPAHPLYYFHFLRVFMFFLLLFNGCYTWILYFMITTPKHKSYCFNVFAKEFKLCSKADFCPIKGISNFIYDDAIFNKTEVDEAIEVNKAYLNFYIKDTSIFSLLNKKYSKTDEIASFYSVVIILTKREKYIFNNTFRNICDNTNTDFFITLVVSMTLGNVIFGYFADLFGRKKMIITLLIFEVIGGLIIYGLTLYIDLQSKANGTAFEHQEKMFDFNIASYAQITQFIGTTNRSEFEMTDLNNIYFKDFSNIKKKALQTSFIHANYQRYKLLLFIGIFFLYMGNSSVFTITYAYFMENAVTEDYFYSNNFILHSSKPSGILLTFFLVLGIDSFETPLLIINICVIILIFIFIFCFFESQRWNLEYCYYTEITNFVYYILGENNAKTNYKEITQEEAEHKKKKKKAKERRDKEILEESKVEEEKRKKEEEEFNNRINQYPPEEREIEQEKRKKYLSKLPKLKEAEEKKEEELKPTLLYHDNSASIQTEMAFFKENQECTIWTVLSSKYNTENAGYKSIKKDKQDKKENPLKREKLLSDPKYMIELMTVDKQIKNHFFIILAFISVVGIVSHLCFGKITSSLFYSRKDLVDKVLFSSNTLIFCCVSILVTFIYNFTLKLFGTYYMILVSFSIIIIFSFIFEMLGLVSRDNYDQNTTLYNSYELIAEKFKGLLLWFIYFCLMGSTGLIIGMYFFITKLTKTIYRCSFFSYCQICMDITFVLSMGLEQFIEKTFFYVCLFSIIGFINSFFITTNDDDVIIKDFRKIYIENPNKNKEHHS